ncbi:MAG: GntR family transcriptional regulator [Streptosporangiaceae bacterium]
MADPMWRRIAEELRDKIESGELGSQGKPLPSEMELRDAYDASRNTIRDAVKWLVARGLVVTRPGRGTFVVKKIDPFVTTLSADIRATTLTTAYASEVAARSRRSDATTPRIEIQQATELVSQQLRLDKGSEVVSRHQERFIDGMPWSLQTTFYPMDFVDRGAVRLIRAEEIVPGAVAYIEETLGIEQAGWRDKLMVRPPDAREALFFELPDDGRIAVVEVVRTGYDRSGSPFRVTVTTYPADRNQFVVTAGNVPEEEIPGSAPVGVPGSPHG